MFEDAPLEPFPLHLRFRVVPVRAGEQFVCWVIGPQVICKTHYDKRRKQTKACRAWITKGKLPCPLGARCCTRTTSYQPLRVHQGEERMVVVFSHTAALAAKDVLHQGTCLMLYRPKPDNHPPLKWKLLVGTDDPAPAITANVRRQTPWEIKPYLLHLWQDE
jgi:hypothetical protein